MMGAAAGARRRLPEVSGSPSGGVRDPSEADHYDDFMTRQLTATEAKARFLALLHDVAAGEEIEITKHGRKVARLVPAGGGTAGKGRLAGRARSTPEDEMLYSTGERWDSR